MPLDIANPPPSAEVTSVSNRPATLLGAFSLHLLGTPSTCTTIVLPLVKAMAGRVSTHPICLRVEPISSPENRAATLKISREQFHLDYRGTHVELLPIGQGSTTEVIGPVPTALSPGIPVRCDDQLRLRVGGVLDLELTPAKRIGMGNPEGVWTGRLGVDQGGAFDYVRLRRLNNLPEQQTVLLFGEGIIAPEPGAMAEVPLPAPTARGRAFDLGPSTDESRERRGARVFIRDDRLWIESRGFDPVEMGGDHATPSSAIQLAGTTDLGIGPWKFAVEWLGC